MYGKNVKQWKILGIVSLGLALAGCIIGGIVNLVSGAVTGGELLLLIVLGPILMCLGFTGLILNFGKIMKGIIIPIPILSMLIEYFRGIYWAIRGYIWLFVQIKKGRDNDYMEGDNR
ncbi:MAG: hypothetical protein IJO93_02480 [Clostridia bacterium]|nr:hypothetical protein [Clostridia bacterium]